MKKFLYLTACCLFISGMALAEYVNPNDSGIYDKYQVIYSPSGKYFAQGGMVEDRIVLTKKTGVGSGGYSEYYKNDQLAFTLGSNFEFVSGPKLIAVHNNDLTFSEVVYNKGKFSEKKMSVAEVQAVFPDVKIIKISEFHKGEYTLRKGLFETVRVLILNDVGDDFYRYSFRPSSVKKTDVAGLIEISDMDDVEFSHYSNNNDLYPEYEIDVEWDWFGILS